MREVNFEKFQVAGSGLVPEGMDPTIGRLLSLFPEASPVRIAVRVGLPHHDEENGEKSHIQFGLNDMAILVVNRQLICGEIIGITPPRGVIEAQAVVVVAIPHGSQTSVAVRFMNGVPKWFHRPLPV